MYRFHFIKANLGFLRIEVQICLIAPFILSPPPTILWKASRTVLLGILSRVFLSFSDFTLLSIMLLLIQALKSFHWSIADFGLLRRIWFILVNALRTRLEPNCTCFISRYASLRVRFGSFSNRFLSLCVRMLLISLCVLIRSK